MPNFIEIEQTFRGRTDGRTYTCMDRRTFETGFIKSTLPESRPNNFTPQYVSFIYFFEGMIMSDKKLQ